MDEEPLRDLLRLLGPRLSRRYADEITDLTGQRPRAMSPLDAIQEELDIHSETVLPLLEAVHDLRRLLGLVEAPKAVQAYAGRLSEGSGSIMARDTEEARLVGEAESEATRLREELVPAAKARVDKLEEAHAGTLARVKYLERARQALSAHGQ